MSVEGPLASVVVPVRDDAPGLRVLVEDLAAQTFPRDAFEVIVADDGSTDGGADGLEADHTWLRVTRGPPLGSFAARNRGASLARGLVLAFTDADCRPAADWLERGMVALVEADLAAGRVDPMLPHRPAAWSLIDMGTWHDVERLVRAGGAVTANLLVRKEWFDRVGGFDESQLSGGDFQFALRCLASGARGVFAHDAVVGHPVAAGPGPVLRRVWFRNFWVGVQAARAGTCPERTSIRYLVPGMNVWRRRRAGLSPGLDRPRLKEAGISVSRSAELRACLIRDLFVSYWVAAAQLRGWWGAHSPRTTGSRSAPPPAGAGAGRT